MLRKPEPMVALSDPCPCGSGRKYNRRPDEEIPALDGHTPREAARDRELRPRLVSLLKDMELQQARASGAMASFDLSFLWAKLGLKRP